MLQGAPFLGRTCLTRLALVPYLSQMLQQQQQQQLLEQQQEQQRQPRQQLLS